VEAVPLAPVVLFRCAVAPTPSVDGEHVGVAKKVFGKLYEIQLNGRKATQWPA
jgi:hypothetical protein